MIGRALLVFVESLVAGYAATAAAGLALINPISIVDREGALATGVVFVIAPVAAVVVAIAVTVVVRAPGKMAAADRLSPSR